jgi:hypothetical protein
VDTVPFILPDEKRKENGNIDKNDKETRQAVTLKKYIFRLPRICDK